MTTQMQSHGMTPAREKLIHDIQDVCRSSSCQTIEVIAILGNLLGQIIGATAGNEKSIMAGIDTATKNLQQGIQDQVLCAGRDHGNA